MKEKKKTFKGKAKQFTEELLHVKLSRMTQGSLVYVV